MCRYCLAILIILAAACRGDVRNDDLNMPDTNAAVTTKHVPNSIDHILLIVNDLDSGMNQFERMTGVKPQVGGAHPGRGTQNALVSLGDAMYVEIIAPNPDDVAGEAAAAQAAPYDSLTPISWAIRSEDLDALVARLRQNGVATGPITPGSRVRPSGAKLEWRTLMLAEAAQPFAPFFIQWGAFSQHPATTSPMGCTLRDLRFEHPAPDELRSMFSALGIETIVEQGPRPRMQIELACPRGMVTFPSND